MYTSANNSVICQVDINLYQHLILTNSLIYICINEIKIKHRYKSETCIKYLASVFTHVLLNNSVKI